MSAREWLRGNGTRLTFVGVALISGYNAAAAQHQLAEAERNYQRDLAAQGPSEPTRQPTSRPGPTPEATQRKETLARKTTQRDENVSKLRDVGEEAPKLTQSQSWPQRQPKRRRQR